MEKKPVFYSLLADITLLLHFSFVVFIIGGLLATLLGGVCGWQWVRNPWFRLAHLFGILVVIVQAWIGMVCPLTTLEIYWRDRAGGPTYEGTFVAHWLHRMLFFEADPWVFAVAYTVFGSAVAAAWLIFPPRPFIEKGQR